MSDKNIKLKDASGNYLFPRTNISNVTDLSTTLAGKANTATTLAGYGITDAYTKTETDGKVTGNVENSVTSTSTTKALSANMGKELQDQISNLQSRGRYLSGWNCTTGLPVTNPVTSGTYTYRTGDYYVVSVVGTTNYKPDGTSYTAGTASTTAAESNVAVNDTYFFDGSTWSLQRNALDGTTFVTNVGVGDNKIQQTINGTTSDVTSIVTSVNGSSGAITNVLAKTENENVSVLGTTKNTTSLGGNQLVAPNGIIFSGTAANAGLVTRGICGVTSPSATGECTKDNLFINFDSTSDFNPARQMVLQAPSVGTHYGSNLYQYCVPRGDIVKNWVESKGYLTSHQDITGKLDKVTSVTTADQVYIKAADGSQTLYDCYQGSAAANSICRRTSDGSLNIANVIMTNGKYLQCKNTGGTAINIATIDVGNNLVFGDANMGTSNYIAVKRTMRPSTNIGSATGVDLGASGGQFRNAYIQTIYENGKSLAAKYLPNFSLNISHQSAGNPRQVKFLSVNYSSVATYFKMGATSCHDNGTSYQFLEDIIIGVTTAGNVVCNVYKYCQASCNTIDGALRYYGDVYYTIDTTNKVVDFYILCGQWSQSQFTPITRIGNTSIAYVTQYSGNATYYSSGTRNWANGDSTTYAIKSDIPTFTLSGTTLTIS